MAMAKKPMAKKVAAKKSVTPKPRMAVDPNSVGAGTRASRGPNSMYARGYRDFVSGNTGTKNTLTAGPAKVNASYSAGYSAASAAAKKKVRKTK